MTGAGRGEGESLEDLAVAYPYSLALAGVSVHSQPIGALNPFYTPN
jgi:hypothetical protein